MVTFPSLWLLEPAFPQIEHVFFGPSLLPAFISVQQQGVNLERCQHVAHAKHAA